MTRSSHTVHTKEPAVPRPHPLQRRASQIGIALLLFALLALLLHLFSRQMLVLFDRSHAPTSSGYLPPRTILLRTLLCELLRLLCTAGALLPSLVLLHRICRIPFCQKGHSPFAAPPRPLLTDWLLLFLPVIGIATILTPLLRFLLHLFIPLSSIQPPVLPDFPLLLLSFCSFCLLPALLEELLFRGCILQALLPFGERFAVIVSCLLFGFLHASMLQLPALFLVSYFLGWAAVRTHSCLVSILLHLLYNTGSLLLSYAVQHLTPFAAPLLSILFLAVCFLTGILLLPGMRRQGRLPRALCPAAEKPGAKSRLSLLFSSPLFAGSMVLLFCYCILLHVLRL